MSSANISDQNNRHNVHTLATALVYARSGDRHYGDKTRDAIAEAVGTEAGGRTLALGRNLVAYVIAADLIDLGSYDPAQDRRFRQWLHQVRYTELSGRTLISTHEDRPNNWGSHAGASRVAASAYLGDDRDVARAAQVFKGWLGDRPSYDDFEYGDDLSWQAVRYRPVGINPVGATIKGRDVDGAQPEEMRRSGSFDWPPERTGYAWEGLQGAVVQAELLSRQGYPAWQWSDQAIRRAVDFLDRLDQEFGGWYATGDDTWQPWLINSAYNTNYPTEAPSRPGKNIGWTDWTHGGRS